MSAIAPTLQGFFTERLIKQRRVSPATIVSYRDSLRVAAAIHRAAHRQAPSALDWADLDVEMISAFLEHLETDRHNRPQDPQPPPDRDPVAVHLRRAAPPRTRRAHPAGARHPAKRFDKPTVSFLTPAEIDALLAAPDLTGGRDAATARCCCWPCRPGCGSPS